MSLVSPGYSTLSGIQRLEQWVVTGCLFLMATRAISHLPSKIYARRIRLLPSVCLRTLPISYSPLMWGVLLP